MLERAASSLSVRGVFGSLAAIRGLLAGRVRRLGVAVEDRWYHRRGLGPSGLPQLIEAGAFRGATILSARFDGFGPRFGEVLNGWRVAQALGARYRFYWPERAVLGIRPAGHVFSEGFIADHALESVRLSHYRDVRFFRLRDLAAMASHDVVLWYRSKDSELGTGKFNVASRGFQIPGLMTHSEAFAQIPLSPRLSVVREWAQSLPSFDLAIHVRRGDIYEGDFRFGGPFVDKALPLPVVERLLAGLESGSRILLVGNDLERVLTRLPSGVAFHVPSEFSLHLPLGPDIDDFLDFCLLARSKRIIAGHSAFALIPSRIAGVRLELPGDSVPREELIEVLWRFVLASPRIVDLEVALACEYLRNEYGESLSERELDELVEIGRLSDPSNPVYVLRSFTVSYRRSGGSVAAEALRSAVDHGVPELCVRLLRQELDLQQGVGLTRIWTGFLTEEDRSTLMSAAGHDGWAAFYAALDVAARGDLVRAREVLALAPNIVSSHPAFVAAAQVLESPTIRHPRMSGGSLITPTREELGEAPVNLRRLWRTRGSRLTPSSRR